MLRCDAIQDVRANTSLALKCDNLWDCLAIATKNSFKTQILKCVRASNHRKDALELYTHFSCEHNIVAC